MEDEKKASFGRVVEERRGAGGAREVGELQVAESKGAAGALRCVFRERV